MILRVSEPRKGCGNFKRALLDFLEQKSCSHVARHVRMPWYEWLWSSSATTSKSGSTAESKRIAKLDDKPSFAGKDSTFLGEEAAEVVKRDVPTGKIKRHFSDPFNLIAAGVLTTVTLGSFAVYWKFLRRIPQASLIRDSDWRRRSLLGYVTRVGDGDNFHLYHTPGGRLAGWGWLPWRQVPKKGRELKDRTVHVRFAGIDAPEMAHFGKPEQPGGREAIDWLKQYILHRRVRAYVYKKDLYDRAVATVYVWRWCLRRDVGLQMLNRGLATIYDAKTGAEFGAFEDMYRKAEQRAKAKKKGIWSGDMKDFESPRDYKNRLKGKGE
ncbi:uncharacterized protein KY384_008464 [Bacidia gigantensis]|uniref:uncharacterized protein n=1 Tax=Bacidia gigantensis TaxID=2732470 RepID=UPI001D055291|nr:uncharacterized protein KY384_008464 [Bacidia gigantensis]KAG8527035.1 hypothetical protein KY384_008464 [Bacidia gigantensis]